MFPLLQRGEAKLLTEDWEGAVSDLKEASQKSPQVGADPSCSMCADYVLFINDLCIVSDC